MADEPSSAKCWFVSGRHVDERLALAAPGLFRLVRRGLFRLPPGSTMRRRFLKRSAVLGWDAYARGDYDVALIPFDPQYELNLFGDWFRGVGFPPRYVGHTGLIDFAEAWGAVWSSVEYDVEQLFDLGDRIVIRFTTTSRGAASGAEVRQTAGAVYKIVDGTITRMDFYWDWADCATAAGVARSAVV
jgi:ketosteroid isomerase-like protein